MEGFAQTIRDGRPNLCDGTEGLNAAVAAVMGSQAVDQKAKLEIPGAAYGLEGLS